MSEGNLKDANRLVGEWGMRATFPTLEADYQLRTMEKLLAKGLWGAASGFALNNPEFQVRTTRGRTTKAMLEILKSLFKGVDFASLGPLPPHTSVSRYAGLAIILGARCE